MLLRLVSLTVFLLFISYSGLSAQTLLAQSSADVIEATTLHVVSDGDDSIFFTDPESKVCFIDFAEIDGDAKHLIVRKGDKEILIDEAVWDLPANIMYELDFEEFDSGNYKIELHTYSNVITKKLDVR